MVLVVGQNSTWQKSYELPRIQWGEVNRIAAHHASAAGKGANTVRALAFLRTPGLLLAYTGGPDGDKFRAACREDALPAEFVSIVGETRTCTTLLEEHGEVTELVEPGPEVGPEERARFAELVERHLPQADFLVLAGTAMVGESADCFRDWVRAAHEHGCAVLLDSYREQGRRALEAAPEILKINSSELSALAGLPVETRADRELAAETIRGRHGVRWVIVTRGADGAEGFDGQRVVVAAPPGLKPVNTIGSGDSFTAGVVATLAARPLEPEGSLAEAIRVGAAMGSANCLNLKPAWIEAADYAWALERVTLSVLPPGSSAP